MTTKQYIGAIVMFSFLLVGFIVVAHGDLVNIEADTKATACGTLNHTAESIDDCIADD